MRDSKPLVSIGMPVYNDERYLPRALESLLAQDFSDFELIISDDASSDASPAICMDYAARDIRIRYSRNRANLGAVKNFNRVFNLSQGEYFMWASADDRWHPSYLSRCLEVLRSDSSVVLVYPQAILTDDNGKEYGTMFGGLDTRDYRPTMRFYSCIMWFTEANAIYGLIRADALKKTRLFRDMLSQDLVLLSELSLLGAFAHISKPLFYRRKMREGETKQGRERRWMDLLGPQNRGRRVYFPYWKTFCEYLTVAWHAPLNLRQRLKLVAGTCLFYPGMHWNELLTFYV
jgi:glycosyltransferase involved in cell wall biosynthesis